MRRRDAPGDQAAGVGSAGATSCFTDAVPACGEGGERIASCVWDAEELTCEVVGVSFEEGPQRWAVR